MLLDKGCASAEDNFDCNSIGNKAIKTINQCDRFVFLSFVRLWSVNYPQIYKFIIINIG